MQEFQSMQEHLFQEQIELVLHEYLLVQMTLLICHVTKDKLPNLQPEIVKKYKIRYLSCKINVSLLSINQKLWFRVIFFGGLDEHMVSANSRAML
jgi:hypothetical protein